MNVTPKGSKAFRVFRGTVAVGSLVFLINNAALPVIWALEYSLPKGKLAGVSANGFVEILLFVLSAFGSVIVVIISATAGAVIWLFIMKLLYKRAEVDILLGLNLGEPSPGKRLLKRFLDAVF